jgi:nucleoside-diphosphate-sugar epimerase
MSEINFINKKVLITGGCGFIGSHLVKRMLSEGARVFIMKRKNTKAWRIKDELNEVEILETDIADTVETGSAIKRIEPEYVFHLAAYGVDSLENNYITALRTNILGTVNIMSALKDVGCKRVINMGSCAEYGDRKELMKEDMFPEPVSIYGSTKACATIAAHQAARENHINIVTLRPFGIFGEGEERHKIFCHIILSILENKDVKLTSCEQRRDYCYVENIIDGMVMAAKNESLKNNIFNIASGRVHPLSYYVDSIFKNMKTDRKPLYGAVEYRKNEMWAPTADIKKIQSILGWMPRIGFEEGIKNTINWYERNKAMYL